MTRTQSTSHEAHEQSQEQQTTQKHCIMKSLVNLGPATRRDLGNRTGMGRKDAGSRVRWLLDRGLCTHGERTVNVETGKKAYLVEPTEKGEAWLEGDVAVDDDVRGVQEVRRGIVKQARELKKAHEEGGVTVGEANDVFREMMDLVGELEDRDGRL